MPISLQILFGLTSCQCSRQLKLLKALTLILPAGPDTSVDAGDLLGGMSTLDNLSTLALQFNLLERHSLLNIATNLTRMSFLSALELNVFNSKSITDDEVIELIMSLRDYRSLRWLTLGFIACEQVGDATLIGFSSIVSGLASLRTLALNFSHCSGLSDAGLEILCSSLSGLKNILRLDLAIIASQNATHEKIEEVKMRLMNLT